MDRFRVSGSPAVIPGGGCGAAGVGDDGGQGGGVLLQVADGLGGGLPGAIAADDRVQVLPGHAGCDERVRGIDRGALTPLRRGRAQPGIASPAGGIQ
jgi:hypothetical protein